MPAKSKAMRIASAIAENHPEKLFARNRGLLQMSPEDLHDYAATPEKGLPKKARPYAGLKGRRNVRGS